MPRRGKDERLIETKTKTISADAAKLTQKRPARVGAGRRGGRGEELEGVLKKRRDGEGREEGECLSRKKRMDIGDDGGRRQSREGRRARGESSDIGDMRDKKEDQ